MNLPNTTNAQYCAHSPLYTSCYSRLGGVRVVSVDLSYLAQHEHSLTTEEQIKAAGHISERDFNETAEALQEHYLQCINDPLSRDTPNLRNMLLFTTLNKR